MLENSRAGANYICVCKKLLFVKFWGNGFLSLDVAGANVGAPRGRTERIMGWAFHVLWAHYVLKDL